MKKIKRLMVISLALSAVLGGCSSSAHVPDGTPMDQAKGDTSLFCVFESRLYNVGSTIVSAGALHTCTHSGDKGDSAVWEHIFP